MKEEIAQFIYANPGCRMPQLLAGVAVGRKFAQKAVNQLAKDEKVQITGASTSRCFWPPGQAKETRRDIALRLISRPEGAAVKEMRPEVGLSRPGLQALLRKLTDEGLIELNRANSNRDSRYYAAGKVPAEEAAKKAKPVELAPKEKHPTMIKQQTRAVHFSGPAIVPENVKRTVIPGWTHDDRYQLPPGTRIVGGFATMGVGRYL